MNDAQLRRRELLRQTKQLYGERETVPPIHPRYGNLCKEQDEGGEEAGGSFYMRLAVSYTHLKYSACISDLCHHFKWGCSHDFKVL